MPYLSLNDPWSWVNVIPFYDTPSVVKLYTHALVYVKCYLYMFIQCNFNTDYLFLKYP